MSTHVIGFKPPDTKWKLMRSIWESCEEANVTIPEDVYDFFNGEKPQEDGVKVSQKQLADADAIRHYKGDMEQGYEILVDMIPSDIKIIRVYNAF